jgi:hypothetical protein
VVAILKIKSHKVRKKFFRVCKSVVFANILTYNGYHPFRLVIQGGIHFRGDCNHSSQSPLSKFAGGDEVYGY